MVNLMSDAPSNLVSDNVSKEVNESINNSKLDDFKNISKSKDAIGIVIGISVTLVTTFALAVIILWAWTTINGGILGLNPPQALLTWEDEYRDLTGVNSLEGLDGTGVSLCIVDSGIDISHPDLSNINLIGWKDVINSVDTPYDDDGHGTAMAGIIVADGGLNGISKKVDLLVAKAINSSGSGTDDGIAEAVDWCVSQGADIISLSLGGEQGLGAGIISTDSLEIAVENAIDEGVYVVAAAGNDGENDDGDVSSPGSVNDVICVGGVTRIGNLWSGSSEGDNNGQ
jgi:serine protease AprX